MTLRYLHLLAMALLIGGQLVLAVAVVPGLRGRDRSGLRAVARRFGWASLGALAVLAATGAAMADWSERLLHAKLALVALAVALVVWHLRAGAARWLQAAVLVVSLAIAWLGVALAH